MTMSTEHGGPVADEPVDVADDERATYEVVERFADTGEAGIAASGGTGMAAADEPDGDSDTDDSGLDPDTDTDDDVTDVPADEPAESSAETATAAAEEPATADDRVVDLVGGAAAPAHPEEQDPPVAADLTGGVVPAPHGWAVLGRALRPGLTRAQVLAGVLCALLGFALVVQVRQGGANLDGLRQADLVRILDETTTRGDALAREAADLRRERDALLSGSDTRQAALDAAERSAAIQGILTGRLPAQGPGVTVTLTESDGAIKPATFLNLLEELRNAGAEAIELNERRVTASSAFTGRAGAVELDGVVLAAPYVWTVIGDPDTIAPALSIRGGAFAQVRQNGGQGTVTAADLVQVTALRTLPEPRFATPVPASTD